jgi:hypothetical protein
MFGSFYFVNMQVIAVASRNAKGTSMKAMGFAVAQLAIELRTPDPA